MIFVKQTLLFIECGLNPTARDLMFGNHQSIDPRPHLVWDIKEATTRFKMCVALLIKEDKNK